MCLLLACASNAPERIDALLAPLGSDHGPGVAAMVIRDGEVDYSSAVGLADVERGIPIGPRTVFDIASVSKQFTGMLGILLHEDGRLDYDAPVVRFLPELARFGDRMTVRHLLTHTSGLPDYYDALARASHAGGWASNRDALASLELQGDLDFPPGDRFAYSDAGYEMLALVLERIAACATVPTSWSRTAPAATRRNRTASSLSAITLWTAWSAAARSTRRFTTSTSGTRRWPPEDWCPRRRSTRP